MRNDQPQQTRQRDKRGGRVYEMCSDTDKQQLALVVKPFD
ncbi:hypothetical protein D515_02307 [Grimontia indica]|uniref:Uncharacterized protein n=1 Tax=Grimontia indica TaxID=1056512 RepID=R1IDG6_9GAMM|nr:hypothetical protein D515_02307 [Grimontia indica]